MLRSYEVKSYGREVQVFVEFSMFAFQREKEIFFRGSVGSFMRRRRYPILNITRFLLNKFSALLSIKYFNKLFQSFSQWQLATYLGTTYRNEYTISSVRSKYNLCLANVHS